MIYNIKNNNVRYLMKKNRNPERTKTLKEKGKIPFRYRFFLGGASFFLALMILVTGVAFAFRETIDLYLSGSRTNVSKEAKEKDPVTRLEMLIERIHEIQQEIPETEENISPEEQAFLEAANEQYEAVGALRNHLRARRTY